MLRSHPTARRRSTGFTLVEILIVLGIVGVAAAMVVPQMSRQDDLVAKAAARVVSADLSYAQSRSILLKQKHFIQFTGQQYTLLTRSSDASALQTIQNPVTHETYITAFDVPNTSLANVHLKNLNFGTSTMIGFDELGSPFSYDAAANVTTSFSSAGSLSIGSGSASVAISVLPYTGDVSVN